MVFQGKCDWEDFSVLILIGCDYNATSKYLRFERANPYSSPIQCQGFHCSQKLTVPNHRLRKAFEKSLSSMTFFQPSENRDWLNGTNGGHLSKGWQGGRRGGGERHIIRLSPGKKRKLNVVRNDNEKNISASI